MLLICGWDNAVSETEMESVCELVGALGVMDGEKLSVGAAC